MYYSIKCVLSCNLTDWLVSELPEKNCYVSNESTSSDALVRSCRYILYSKESAFARKHESVYLFQAVQIQNYGSLSPLQYVDNVVLGVKLKQL